MTKVETYEHGLRDIRMFDIYIHQPQKRLFTLGEHDRINALRKLKDAAFEADQFAIRVDKLVQARDAARLVTDAQGRIDAWCSFHDHLVNAANEFGPQRRIEESVGVTKAQVRSDIKDAVQERYANLIEKREERSVFLLLVEFLAYINYHGWYYGLKTKSLDYPADWNDLLARHYDTPDIHLFKRLPERGAGDIRLLAAQAIREDNLTIAQITLAYCNSESIHPHAVPYVTALGGELMAELAKLVERHRAELNQSTSQG